MNLDLFHLPALREARPSGICRATPNIIAIACSAVVIHVAEGVFITNDTLFEAASCRCVVPDAGRAINLQLVAFARICQLPWYRPPADRIASPS